MVWSCTQWCFQSWLHNKTQYLNCFLVLGRLDGTPNSPNSKKSRLEQSHVTLRKRMNLVWKKTYNWIMTRSTYPWCFQIWLRSNTKYLNCPVGLRRSDHTPRPPQLKKSTLQQAHVTLKSAWSNQEIVSMLFAVGNKVRYPLCATWYP